MEHQMSGCPRFFFHICSGELRLARRLCLGIGSILETEMYFVVPSFFGVFFSSELIGSAEALGMVV